eukprot:scaffold4437_cov115-Isochrysis_galbana.AAC.1
MDSLAPVGHPLPCDRRRHIRERGCIPPAPHAPPVPFPTQSRQCTPSPVHSAAQPPHPELACWRLSSWGLPATARPTTTCAHARPTAWW